MTCSHTGMPVCLRASSRQSSAARSCAKHDHERNVMGCSQTLKNDTLTHSSLWADHSFQSVLNAETLNERGHQLAFAKRQRLITPFRFGLSVIASMATQQVPSIASLHRDFNALWDAESSYKAFYNQVAKASCAEFLRTSLCDIMSQLTMKGIR